MPTIGDEIRASEIGKEGQRIFVWVGCPTCSEERWAIRKSSPYQKSANTKRLCRPCTTKNASKFLGASMKRTPSK